LRKLWLNRGKIHRLGRIAVAAGRAPAIAEVQPLFDRAPVRFVGYGETQTRAARGEGSFSNGEAMGGAENFCLLFV
jgi:hypothetical protein